MQKGRRLQAAPLSEQHCLFSSLGQIQIGEIRCDNLVERGHDLGRGRQQEELVRSGISSGLALAGAVLQQRRGRIATGG